MAIGFYESRIIDSDDLYSTVKLWKQTIGFPRYMEANSVSSDGLYSTVKLWKQTIGFTGWKSSAISGLRKGHPKRKYREE